LELFKAGVLLLFIVTLRVGALGDTGPAPTHFAYKAPDATKVEVAGEFNGWKPAAMTKGADGTWTADIAVPAGAYGYKFIVNGTDWELDPANPNKKTVDGIDNSALTVGGPAPAAAAAGGNGVVFTYSNATAGAVFVAGQFNGWNTSATPMSKGADGTWTATVPLSPGSYQYKLFVDGAWMLDPGNPEQADDGTGNKNSVKVVGAGGTTAPVAAASPAGSAPVATATPAPATGPMALGGTQIKEGEFNKFDIPLPDETWRQTFIKLPVAHGEPRAGDDMKLKAAGVHVAMVVPQNFDPAKRYPLLIVSSGGGGSSIDQLDSFSDVAADEGWVSIAIDPNVDHSSDSNLVRWAATQATLDYLHEQWPATKEWPVAVAGFDGGAWKSGYLAALLSRQGYNLIGIWLGGAGDESASKAMREYNPPHGKYLHTPVFVSSGKADKNTPPEKVRGVYRSIQSAGFEGPKLGTFAGAHEVDADQVKQGLDWFLAAMKGKAAAE
jgi:hypothetical protein